jgi:hypothetical protein
LEEAKNDYLTSTINIFSGPFLSLFKTSAAAAARADQQHPAANTFCIPFYTTLEPLFLFLN